jgi:hypothetical protein
MRTLSETELLDLWEIGYQRHPLDRALLALTMALPDTSYESLADWPLGQRNLALTKFYSQCFGPRLRAWTTCRNCGEKLEFEMDTDLLAAGETWERDGPNEPIIVNGRAFRLPSSRDLALAANETNPSLGAVRIVENCLMESTRAVRWSENDLSEIGEKLALADPLAEIRVNAPCPECGNDGKETLDLVSFIWNKIEARIRHLLLDIHILASAYGWSEADILAMSKNRRSMYIEMVQA